MKAKWRIGTSEVESKVVGMRMNRVEVEREVHGESIANFLKFDTIINEEEVRKYFDSTNDCGGFDPMDYPTYSRNGGSKWLALDCDLEVLSEHNKHKDLKSHYGVGKVKGVKIDGEKHYKLYYNPKEVE